jgi:hypothetical protein
MHPCPGWAQHCLRWETVAHAHTHCKEGVGTPMRSCPDERRRYPAGSGPHRHKGQTQAPGSWPSPSRHTRPQPRGSRREGPRCAVHHPHALPWPGNDSLVAPDRGDAGTGGSGRMLEQGYLATLCYLSPKTGTPYSIDVSALLGYLHYSPCRLCYDGVASTHGGQAPEREKTRWTLWRWWIKRSRSCASGVA